MIVAIIGSRKRSTIKGNPKFQTLEKDAQKLLVKDGPRLIDVCRNEYNLADVDVLEKLVSRLKQTYKNGLSIVSVGCDDGIGLMTRAVCTQQRIYFTEISCLFSAEKNRAPSEYAKFYTSRNASIVEVADEFYLLKADKEERGVVDDLEKRLRALEEKDESRPFYIIQEDGTIAGEQK